MTVTADRFVDACRSLIGVRFGHRGRSAQRLDCGGLIVRAAEIVGESVEDVYGYSRTGRDAELLDVARSQTSQVAWADRQPGDVVVMWWSKRCKEAQHLGILDRMPDGADGLIHSFIDARRVVRCHLGVWESRILYVGRLRFIEGG